jgi:ABC-type enterochelin transport system substrate-binding protein
MLGVPRTFGQSILKSEDSDMDYKRECAVINLLRQIKGRIGEEAEYDYEAMEIVHKIDRIIVGKPFQKNYNHINDVLNKVLVDNKFAESQ